MGEWLIGTYVFVLAIASGVRAHHARAPHAPHPAHVGGERRLGITLIGALLVAGSGLGSLPALLGGVAVFMAAINVVGGFLVTDRMLRMFRKH